MTSVDCDDTLVTDRKNGDSKYTYFLDNKIIAEHQWAILGIHEVTGCDADVIDEQRPFSTDYSLSMFLSGCYYLDAHQTWRSDGVRVRQHVEKRLILILLSSGWIGNECRGHSVSVHTFNNLCCRFLCAAETNRFQRPDSWLQRECHHLYDLDRHCRTLPSDNWLFVLQG